MIERDLFFKKHSKLYLHQHILICCKLLPQYIEFLLQTASLIFGQIYLFIAILDCLSFDSYWYSSGEKQTLKNKIFALYLLLDSNQYKKIADLYTKPNLVSRICMFCTFDIIKNSVYQSVVHELLFRDTRKIINDGGHNTFKKNNVKNIIDRFSYNVQKLFSLIILYC